MEISACHASGSHSRTDSPCTLRRRATDSAARSRASRQSPSPSACAARGISVNTSFSWSSLAFAASMASSTVFSAALASPTRSSPSDRNDSR